MNIVFDTNVLISDHVFKGKAAVVFDYCIIHHTCFISAFIKNEFKEKLLTKFKFSDDEVSELFLIIDERLKSMEPTIPMPNAVLRDPSDNNIVQLAEFSKSDFIITGDKDLLELKSFNSTIIINPAMAIEIFGL